MSSSSEEKNPMGGIFDPAEPVELEISPPPIRTFVLARTTPWWGKRLPQHGAASCKFCCDNVRSARPSSGGRDLVLRPEQGAPASVQPCRTPYGRLLAQQAGAKRWQYNATGVLRSRQITGDIFAAIRREQKW